LGLLSYLSPELINLNACLYHTLNSIFPYVRTIPGESNIILVSASADVISLTPYVLAQRLQDRALQTKLLSDFHIQYKLDKAKEDWFLDAVNRVPNLSINRDLEPSGLYYDMSLWSSLVFPQFTGMIELMGKAKVWHFVIALVLFLLIFLTLRKGNTRLKITSVTVAIITTGFSGMAINIVLILAFQTFYGYVFQMIALITALFMAGIAMGSTVMNQIMARFVNSKRLMVYLESIILIYTITITVMLFVLHSNLGQSALFAIIQPIIFTFNLFLGILIGSEFPLANKIYLGNSGRVSEVVGKLYASDLIGAWVGALVVSIWLIPILGIVNTCILIGGVKMVSFILVTTSKI